MFNPKRIHKDYVLVRINRKKQLAKRLGEGVIINDPQNTDMLFNQQCGEILMIGDRMKELLPQAQIGDTLLFHHSVEGTYETKHGPMQEMNLMWLINDDEPDWRYYVVREPLAYAVAKEDGSIFMMPEIIFAEAREEEIDTRETEKVGSIILFKNYKQSRDLIMQRIEDLKQESLGRRHPSIIKRIMDEMQQLTKALNKYRLAAFTPLYVSKAFNKDCGKTIDSRDAVLYGLLGSKDIELQVTDITYNNKTYYVLRTSQVYAIIPFQEKLETTTSQEHYLLH